MGQREVLTVHALSALSCFAYLILRINFAYFILLFNFAYLILHINFAFEHRELWWKQTHTYLASL